MRLVFCPVCTSKSVYRVMSPLRFFVPSMLNSGRGWWNLVTGSRSWYARSSLMKFSVAPESSSDSISALLDAVCIYALMVIDFLSDKYTRSSVPLLIQAAQIRAFKNPTLWFPWSGLHSFGVVFLCPLAIGLGLGLVGRLLGHCLSWFLQVAPHKSSMAVLGILVIHKPRHNWL